MVRSGLCWNLRVVIGLRFPRRHLAVRPRRSRLVPGGRSPLVGSADQTKLSHCRIPAASRRMSARAPRHAVHPMRLSGSVCSPGSATPFALMRGRDVIRELRWHSRRAVAAHRGMHQPPQHMPPVGRRPRSFETVDDREPPAGHFMPRRSAHLQDTPVGRTPARRAPSARSRAPRACSSRRLLP